MIRKLLIANRGEIALRIVRTCERMGIGTVAVYSDADWNAPHVRRANESVRIGPARAAASYLNIDAVMQAVRSTGADALHPGYGFLSENPALPEACAAAGVTFVGPSADAMRALGDKTSARRLAERHGVPVLPGCDLGDAPGEDILRHIESSIGLPLMVKAAAGGGGRGMRLVADADQLADALAAARREAFAAFGDGRIFVERAVVGGRHVEVQILADQHGHALHLGERDCSTQRRHQKVIEESPAPGLDDRTRQRLAEAALTVARAAGYTNAGTVEFLLDRDNAFYFLEVNARLQVEHPVTELVTGLDLVELQIRVASGEPLALRQDQIRIEGHAVECRVCAEDPERGHLPTAGHVSYAEFPSGDGVRIDSGIETGTAVPPEYDSLLAKIVVHAPSRAEALERCASALASTAIDGVRTNLGLLEAVIRQPAFQAGAADLRLLESMAADSFAAQIPDDALVAAAAADVTPLQSGIDDPWEGLGAWRAAGCVELAYEHHGRTFAVRAMATGGRRSWRMSLRGRDHDVEVARPSGDEVVLRADGRESRWRVRREVGRVLVEQSDGLRFSLGRPRPSAAAGGAARPGARAGEMRAPMPGVVVRVMAAEGELVAVRQPLIVLEAMKMEHIVESTIDGVVRRVRVAVGDRVAEGDILVDVASGGESGNEPA